MTPRDEAIVKRHVFIQHSKTIMLFLTAFGVFLMLISQVAANTNRIKDNKQGFHDLQIAADEIKQHSDEQAQRLELQNALLREQGELITCLLALHDPSKFPTADQQKCNDRVAGTSNIDGDFSGVTPEPSNPQPTPAPSTDPEPNVLMELLNSVRGIVPL